MSTDYAIIARKGKLLEVISPTFVIEIPAPQTATLWGIKSLPRRVHWDSSKGLTLYDENHTFIFSYKPQGSEDEDVHANLTGMSRSVDTEVTDARRNRAKSAITAAGRHGSKSIITQGESVQELLLHKKTPIHDHSFVNSTGTPTAVDPITPPQQRPGIPEVPLRNSCKKAMPVGERYGDRVRPSITRDNGKITRRERKVRLRSNTAPGRTESLRQNPNGSQTQTTMPRPPSTPAAPSDNIVTASNALCVCSFQTPPKYKYAASAASLMPGRHTFHSPFNTPGKPPPPKITYQGTARRPATAQDTNASAIDRAGIAIVTGRLGRARTPSPSGRIQRERVTGEVKQLLKEHKNETGEARNLLSGSNGRCCHGQKAAHGDASHTDRATQIPKKSYSNVSSTPRVVIKATASTVQNPLPAPNYLVAPFAKLSLDPHSSNKEVPLPAKSTAVTRSSTIRSPQSIPRIQRPAQLSPTAQQGSKRCLQVSPFFPTDRTASPQPHTPMLPQVKRRRSNAATGHRPLGTILSAVNNKDVAAVKVVDERQGKKGEYDVRSGTTSEGTTHEDNAP
ncbi:MAG: hypothetical protein Q9209_007657 [Squamulea sp. 1 TL-2023]